MPIANKAYLDPSDVPGFINSLTAPVNGITAFATGGQANAVALTASVNRITTVVNAGDSVRLPVATAGAEVVVINAAANSMNVFPSTGNAINALSANAAYAVAANKVVRFICAVDGTWNSLLTA